MVQVLLLTPLTGGLDDSLLHFDSALSTFGLLSLLLLLHLLGP